MRTFPFETWDVFTETAFAGNPLAVVTYAQGLSDAEMQAIAREFNLSETTFILPPDGPDHDARVRIFVPAHEVPFAGHPTIGTALSIASARKSYEPLTLRLEAGDFPLWFDTSGPMPRATFRNPNPPKAWDVEAVDAVTLRLGSAFGLTPGAVAVGAAAPCIAGAGNDFLYAQVGAADLAAINPDAAALGEIHRDVAVGVVAYAPSNEADTDYVVRVFAPAAGIFEDPATGSAACALPAVVARAGALKDGAHSWRIRQGVEMGRPSDIHAAFTLTDGRVGEVEINGAAVHVQSGAMSF
ncbi:MAG: PhzF family phenazine biosynthesis protein [Pseudomonadota bacterium]